MAGGMVARFFVGLTQGIFDRDLSAETVRDRWDDIRNQDGYTVPYSIGDEMALIAKRLQG